MWTIGIVRPSRGAINAGRRGGGNDSPIGNANGAVCVAAVGGGEGGCHINNIHPTRGINFAANRWEMHSAANANAIHLTLGVCRQRRLKRFEVLK